MKGSVSLAVTKDSHSATYHCSEMADHTSRIKASAHFFSLFGAIDNDAILTFWVWTEFSKVTAMALQSP